MDAIGNRRIPASSSLSSFSRKKLVRMADKTSKTKVKRSPKGKPSPKGKRPSVRRLKPEVSQPVIVQR